MRFTTDDFRNWKRKSITLLGMSGVGKTRLSSMLRDKHWFHYSGDYRIATRYLDEEILDNIKRQAMQVPFLRDLLQSDSVYVRNNITVDHLKPLSTFLGMVGNPESGGISLPEFKRRQALHLEAEVKAMLDVPKFIRVARGVYGYDHFVNDAGGSVCELDDESVVEVLAAHTLILYIKATEEDEVELKNRAERSPKPLYYREAFLDEQLAVYRRERNLDYVATMDPQDFVRWVFPRLFRARTPRYEALARRYGYTVTTRELSTVRDESDFVDLLTSAIARNEGESERCR